MAVNNSDILLIQQLLQNELDELSSVELRARISDSTALQEELAYQKQLAEAFNQIGKKELKKYLNKKHDRFIFFVWFRRLLPFALIFLLGSSSFFIWTNSKSIKNPNNSNQQEICFVEYNCKEPNHIHVDTCEIASKKVLKQPGIIKNKTKRKVEYISKKVSHKKLLKNTQQRIYIKKGTLHLNAFTDEELSELRIIKFKKRLFLEWQKQYFEFSKDGSDIIKDQRILQSLRTIKPSKDTMPVEIHPFKSEISSRRVVFKINPKIEKVRRLSRDTIEINNSNLIEDVKSLGKGKSNYIFLNNESYKLEKDSTYNIYSKTIETVINRKIPIYIHDFEKSQYFNNP